MPEPKGKPSADAAPKHNRPIKYPDIVVKMARVDSNDGPMTAAWAKELMGWHEVPEDEASTLNYLLLDPETKKKIRGSNNIHNRWLKLWWAQTIAQDILNRHWRLNGETLIIGESGLVLSAQHRLVALILAVYEWHHGENKEDWHKLWPTEPTIDMLVVYGVKEDSATTRTLDNVQPRTFADVIFASGLFPKLGNSDRNTIARIGDYALKSIWHRTGEKTNALHPQRTHSESNDFLDRHPRLIKAMKHIFDEYSANWKAANRILSPGTATALFFLMAASETDPVKYRALQSPTDKDLDWSKWEEAMNFWTNLVSKTPNSMNEVIRNAIASLTDPDTLRGATLTEKTAIIVKAWNLLTTGGALTANNLKLKYIEDANGRPHIEGGMPNVGGIDYGDPIVKTELDDDEMEEEEEELSEAELKAQVEQAAAERMKTLEGLKTKHPEKILVFPVAGGAMRLWANDAVRAAKALGVPLEKLEGLDAITLPGSTALASLTKLAKVKGVIAIGICALDKDKNIQVNEFDGNNLVGKSTFVGQPLVPKKVAPKPVAVEPEEEEDEVEDTGSNPTPAEIKARAAKEKERHMEEKKGTKPKPKLKGGTTK